MADERVNVLARREILRAYLEVLDRLPELIEICADVDCDADALRTAVENAFGLSSIAADAVLAMQVRRFTPHERQKIKGELAEIETRLSPSGGAQNDVAIIESACATVRVCDTGS